MNKYKIKVYSSANHTVFSLNMLPLSNGGILFIHLNMRRLKGSLGRNLKNTFEFQVFRSNFIVISY